MDGDAIVIGGDGDAEGRGFLVEIIKDGILPSSIFSEERDDCGISVSLNKVDLQNLKDWISQQLDFG